MLVVSDAELLAMEVIKSGSSKIIRGCGKSFYHEDKPHESLYEMSLMK